MCGEVLDDGAPEQATADPSIDHRADLYAAGALAYEMLTGAPLFTARSPQAMLAAHAMLVPEPLLNRRPNTPQPLADLVMRLLEKEPAARPQRAEDALHELGRVIASSKETVAAARPASRIDARARRVRLTISIGIAAAVILVLVAGFVFRRMGLRPKSAAAQSASIAVLPFANMSGDPQNDYLGDGLSEELIGGLSQVRGLQVAARSSSFAFKGKNENVRSIGTTLGVLSVLNGSVRKSGNRLRVTVQLTNVSTGYNLWSETYDREMRDVFAVEDDITHAILTALAVRLRGAQAHGPIVEPTTTDPEAYDLYLKGRYAWNQRGTKLPEAERFFKQAIARDSTFALAWSGLADTYIIMSSWGYISEREAAVIAPRYADKAVSLDSTLQEPRVSLGYAHCHLGKRYEEGLAELRYAIALNPSIGNAHYFYALCLYLSGYPREALVEGLESQRLEPLNAQFFYASSTAYNALGNYDSAIAVARRATKLAPALASPYAMMTVAYAAKGDIARVRWAGQEAVIRRPDLQLAMKAVLAILTHDSAEVTALRPQIMAHLDITANNVAVAYSLTRNADSTLVWLDRVYSVSIDALGIVNFPSFDWLRKDPRFLAFRTKYGIPDVKH